MTPDDLKILRRIPDLDSEAEKRLRFWASTNLPEGEMRIRAYCDLLRFWDKCFPLLREARCVVEAHSTTGQPFPSIAEKLADCLSASHEWLNYINKTQADEWREEACAILTAMGRQGEYTSSLIYFLRTKKNEVEQRETFAALVHAGFISETDSATGEQMLIPFLNTFNPNATKQGHIIWIKKGKNKMISKQQLCDLLLYFDTPKKELPFYSRAIFNIELSGRALSDGQTRNPYHNKELCACLDGSTSIEK